MLRCIFKYLNISAYNKQWAEAQATIDDLLEVELPKEPPKPEKVSFFSYKMFDLKLINAVP